MMFSDNAFVKAVANISYRAERVIDTNKVIQTYVEVGVLPQISNRNNQIIYGRRGTGKTHLFRYLENELNHEQNVVVVYIDGRLLGSAPDYNNTDLPINRRCIALFKDIIDKLYEEFLKFIVEQAPPKADKAYEALNNVYDPAYFRNIDIASKEITERRLDKSLNEAGISVTASVKDSIGVNLSEKESGSLDLENTSKFTQSENDKVLFPDLNYWLTAMLRYTDSTVYFLIDEWSSIHFDVQPYLAEFLKKSFLPIPQISIKIAALEYRSNFTIPDQRNNHIGFELGSDIATNLDLDDYYVFDRNPEKITETFSEILYKHITNELPPKFLEENRINDSRTFIRTLFTDSANFQELVRASEGVIRDMLNIFNLSFFDTHRQGRNKIDKNSVLEASRQWFERDKAENLDPELSIILRKIVDEVIGNKKARSFLIPRQLERHENIQKLFDARVIHFIKRGWADKDNPGLRYNVYGLDYGTYVDLLNTTKKPEVELFDIDSRQNLEDFIVPFDDKRSIRRIILTPEILDI